MRQDCVRSLPEAPTSLCIARNTVCVCVCVCLRLPAPPTPLRPPDVHGSLVKLVGGPRLDALRLSPIFARGSNHPVYHEEHCVCVCAFAIACSPHPPLHPPDVHSPLTKIVGFPCLHASRLHPILARGSNHPLCVCVCHCLFPNLPLRPPTVHSPKSLFGGRATPTFV